MLLAKLHGRQAEVTVHALETKVDLAAQKAAELEGHLDELKHGSTEFLVAGLAAIEAAQMNVESILRALFRAQRSVEIFTLERQVQHVFLDVGYIHPDKDTDFREKKGILNPAQLVAAYANSWVGLLRPAKLQEAVDTYMSRAGFNQAVDVERRSIVDPAQVEDFRRSRQMHFDVDLDDLPARNFEAKLTGVAVALVGARSESRFVSCRVRHDGVYQQKLRDGSTASQLLAPQEVTVIAPVTALESGDLRFPPHPVDLAFGERGVAGSWLLRIPDDEVVDLGGLTEMEIVIGYHCFVGTGNGLLEPDGAPDSHPGRLGGHLTRR